MAPALSTAYPSLLARLTLVHYPLPLQLHAYLLFGLGLGLTYAPALIVTNPLFTYASKAIGVPPEAATSPFGTSAGVKGNNKPLTTALQPTTKRNLSVAGLLAFGLSLSYVGTSAFASRPEDNQLMYAALPLRYLMSAAAAVSWVLDPDSRSVFKATVVMEDLAGALWLTYIMRDWPLWRTFRW